MNARLEEQSCESCGSALSGGRADRRFCTPRCRRDAWTERAHEGRVASVRRLKGGVMSVLLHMSADIDLAPGDRVRTGLTGDAEPSASCDSQKSRSPSASSGALVESTG